MGKNNTGSKRHWWADGVDMKEWVTVLITAIYAVVALILAIKIYCKKLTVIDNDFFWTLSWPVMVIVGFYFAEKIALSFGTAKLPRLPVPDRNNEDRKKKVEDEARVDNRNEYKV